MELILQKDIKNLGKAGDRVRVRPGYARNYLLPKKLALVLNENRLKEWKHRQKITEGRKKKALLEREALLKKLSAVHLVFKREGQTGGRLFGSISPADISRELDQKHRLPVDKRDIAPEPLKTVGEHRVKISLDPKRQTEIKITVQKILSEKDKKAASRPAAENPDRTEALKESPQTKDTPEENPSSAAVKAPSDGGKTSPPAEAKRLSSPEVSDKGPADPESGEASKEKADGKARGGKTSET